jgi:transketolase C-terminal domain/subunit
LGGVKRAVVVEDHSSLGGISSLLSFAGFEGSIERFGWPASWSGQSGADLDLRKAGRIASADIAGRVQELLRDD